MSPASYQTAPPRDACVHPRRAGNGTRTRDPNLGKVVLYQLSYSRARCKSNRSVACYLRPRHRLTGPTARLADRPTVRPSAGEGDRTPDLVNAIHALSQLSYAPAILRPRDTARREHGILPGRSNGVKRFYELFPLCGVSQDRASIWPTARSRRLSGPPGRRATRRLPSRRRQRTPPRPPLPRPPRSAVAAAVCSPAWAITRTSATSSTSTSTRGAS